MVTKMKRLRCANVVRIWFNVSQRHRTVERKLRRTCAIRQGTVPLSLSCTSGLVAARRYDVSRDTFVRCQ